MKEIGPQRIKKITPNMNFRLFTSCPYRLRLKKSELQSTDKVYTILMY